VKTLKLKYKDEKSILEIFVIKSRDNIKEDKSVKLKNCLVLVNCLTKNEKGLSG
jgi:hypothetical protein